MIRRSSGVGGERGFTLIELLVYMLLAVLVLAIAGGLLINSILAQRTIGDSAESTNTSQLVSQTVSAAVRDASAIRVVAGNPAILLVQIVEDARATPPSGRCEAWALTGDELRTVRYAGASSAPADDALVSDWLTSAVGDYATWTRLAVGASAHDDGAGPDPIFATHGSAGVSLMLDIATGNGVTVLIDTTTVSRQPALTGVTPTCF